MKESRVSCLLAVLAVVGCGNSAPTDFHSPSNGETGGNAGAQQGGNSGAGQGGNAGAPQGGSGGSAAVQAGAGAGGSLGGSAGSVPGGAAGVGLGGSTAGVGAIGGGGSSSGGSTGARGGTGGSGTVPYACGTLMCIQGRQMCVHTVPPSSNGTHMYQCLEYPDNCTTVDCSCFCRGAQNSPCGSGSECMCSGDAGRVTVQCGDS